MKQMTIPVKKNAKIEIKASDDLSIQGIEDNVITAIVRQGDALKISERNDGLEIKATSDCRLLIPATAIVTVEKVGGDLAISGITNRVIVGRVSGDLTIEEAEGASVETVSGDTYFKNILSTLEIARIGGDLFGEGVDAITSRAVGGDASLLELRGNVDLNAGGDVELSSSVENLPVITVRSGGDIHLFTASRVNAQLELHSGGEDIVVHAGGQEGDWEIEEVSLPLGEGGSVVTLTAGGDINVTDREKGSNEFESLIERTRAGWENFGLDLEKNIRESLDSVSGTIQRAMHDAEKASEKAGIKIDLSSKYKKNKGFNHGRKPTMVGFSYDEPDSKPQESAGKASDEERMIVLHMLQEKKISIEEAEKLLNALDR